MIDSALEFWSW